MNKTLGKYLNATRSMDKARICNRREEAYLKENKKVIKPSSINYNGN